MDAPKDKIKAALLGELIRYMGKSMVSSLADPEEEKSVSIEVEAEPMEDDEEPKDEKAKRLKKLKSMSEEC